MTGKINMNLADKTSKEESLNQTVDSKINRNDSIFSLNTQKDTKSQTNTPNKKNKSKSTPSDTKNYYHRIKTSGGEKYTKKIERSNTQRKSTDENEFTQANDNNSKENTFQNNSQITESDTQPDPRSTRNNINYDTNSGTSRRNTFKISVILLLLSFIVRSFYIHSGNIVVWDEAHFGKFARSYLLREFFFDVHPPLGKLITAIIGWISGQDTNFKFESGSLYSGDWYIPMRMCHAFVGSLIVPLVFNLLLNFNMSVTISTTISMLLIFENSLICISRLILLDSTLIFYIILTFYCYSVYYKVKYGSSNLKDSENIPESIPKYKNLESDEDEQKTSEYALLGSKTSRFDTQKTKIALLCLGLALACTNSVKWIGIFTMTCIGIMIIIEISYNLANISNNEEIRNIKKYGNLKYTLTHFLNRSLYLIIVPILIYMFCFGVHFIVARIRTSEEGHLSSMYGQTMLTDKDEFYGNKQQYTKQNTQQYDGKNKINRTRMFIPYGNLITLKNANPNGYFLHSHLDLYPNNYMKESGEYQQVTGYHGKDENNYFAFQRVTGNESQNSSDGENIYKNVLNDFLKQGDKVVLLHIPTNKYILPVEMKEKESDWSEDLINKKGKNNLEGSRSKKYAISAVSTLYETSVWEIQDVQCKYNLKDYEKIKKVFAQLYPKKSAKKTKELSNGEIDRFLSGMIFPLTHTFRLYNRSTGTYLSSDSSALPEWGHKQGKIMTSDDSIGDRWNIDMNWFGEDEFIFESEQKKDEKKENERKSAVDRLNTQKSKENISNTQEKDDFDRNDTTNLKDTQKNAQNPSAEISLKSIPYDLNNFSLFQRIKLIWSNYVELNIAMLKTNNGFTVDQDVEPARIMSEAWEWVFMRRGLRMNKWAKEAGAENDKKKEEQEKSDEKSDEKMFYMFGNPFSWYIGLLCIFIGPFYVLNQFLTYTKNYYIQKNTEKGRRNLREQFKSKNKTEEEQFEQLNKKNNSKEYQTHPFRLIYTSSLLHFTVLITISYILHYIPFFIIGRVLYFHHYIPALVLKVISISVVLKILEQRDFNRLFNNRNREDTEQTEDGRMWFKWLCYGLVFIQIFVFYRFKGLTYGFKSLEEVRGVQWMNSWDFL